MCLSALPFQNIIGNKTGFCTICFEMILHVQLFTFPIFQTFWKFRTLGRPTTMPCMRQCSFLAFGSSTHRGQISVSPTLDIFWQNGGVLHSWNVNQNTTIKESVINVLFSLYESYVEVHICSIARKFVKLNSISLQRWKILKNFRKNNPSFHTVWKLLQFSLTYFWQKFRESNVLTKD